MTWQDLLFLHWSLPVSSIRGFVPSELEIDTYAGDAWVAVVPFRMSNVRTRFLPPLPFVGAFPELNVRTYVTVANRPGVWFFSLDAASRFAVEVARRTYHLPYFRARMSCEADSDGIRYGSERDDHRGAPGHLEGRYGPTGPVSHASPSSLESFLVDRYCLYSADSDGTIWRAEIRHAPWPLQAAQVDLATNTYGDAAGTPLAGPPKSVLFARSLDVVAWLPQRAFR